MDLEDEAKVAAFKAALDAFRGPVAPGGDCDNCGAEVYHYAVVADPKLAVFVNDVDLSDKNLCFGCAHGDLVRLPIAVPEIPEPMKKMLKAAGVKGLKKAPESAKHRAERRKYEAAMRRYHADMERAKVSFAQRLRDPAFRAEWDLPAELPDSTIDILMVTMALDVIGPTKPEMPEFMAEWEGGMRGGVVIGRVL